MCDNMLSVLIGKFRSCLSLLPLHILNLFLHGYDCLGDCWSGSSRSGTCANYWHKSSTKANILKTVNLFHPEIGGKVHGNVSATSLTITHEIVWVEIPIRFRRCYPSSHGNERFNFVSNLKVFAEQKPTRCSVCESAPRIIVAKGWSDIRIRKQIKPRGLWPLTLQSAKQPITHVFKL